MDDSDASALVQAALQHDDEAARALVRQLYPMVAKIVGAHRARRTAEEDLCQMIFIKVFQTLSQFSAKLPLEHWVPRIAVNTCLTQIDSEKVRPGLRGGGVYAGARGRVVTRSGVVTCGVAGWGVAAPNADGRVSGLSRAVVLWHVVIGIKAMGAGR